MVYFECCWASVTNGLTILHLAGIVSYCQPDNASYWPKRKQMKEELMVNKKKTCIFIKLVTADYKLKCNTKVTVICNKASKVSLASLYVEKSTRGIDFTSAFMYDLRGLILAKSGIRPAKFSPKRL